MNKPSPASHDRCLIRTISLYQPWATWVIRGWKPIETRTHNRFQGLRRRRFGIHASKWDPFWITASAGLLTPEQLEETREAKEHADAWPTGAVLGTVYAHDYRQLDTADNNGALIDCDPLKVVRNGLFLRAPRPIDPIITGGRQGISYTELPDEACAPEILRPGDQYVWCGMCGYNAMILKADVWPEPQDVECPWCKKANDRTFLEVGTPEEMEEACVAPDYPQMTWPETKP